MPGILFNSKDGRTGAIGLQGPVGPAGPSGAIGPQGPAGPQGPVVGGIDGGAAATVFEALSGNIDGGSSGN